MILEKLLTEQEVIEDFDPDIEEEEKMKYSTARNALQAFANYSVREGET